MLLNLYSVLSACNLKSSDAMKFPALCPPAGLALTPVPQ